MGCHYLSNATCLIRPHLFYALSVVSRTIIVVATLFAMFEERKCVGQVDLSVCLARMKLAEHDKCA